MKLKIFTQPNCPKCPSAKKLGQKMAKEGKLGVEWFDVTEVEGLAEASFYSVWSTPGLIVVDDEGKEVAGWRGEVPQETELKKHV